MKKDIHPDYGPAVIRCACGNEVKTSSTVPKMEVEICSACHPFYTGQKKIVDSAGRVDRFAKRFEMSRSLQKDLEQRKAAKKKRKKKTEKVRVEVDEKGIVRIAKDK